MRLRGGFRCRIGRACAYCIAVSAFGREGSREGWEEVVDMRRYSFANTGIRVLLSRENCGICSDRGAGAALGISN